MFEENCLMQSHSVLCEECRRKNMKYRLVLNVYASLNCLYTCILPKKEVINETRCSAPDKIE